MPIAGRHCTTAISGVATSLYIYISLSLFRSPAVLSRRQAIVSTTDSAQVLDRNYTTSSVKARSILMCVLKEPQQNMHRAIVVIQNAAKPVAKIKVCGEQTHIYTDDMSRRHRNNVSCKPFCTRREDIYIGLTYTANCLWSHFWYQMKRYRSPNRYTTHKLLVQLFLSPDFSLFTTNAII